MRNALAAVLLAATSVGVGGCGSILAPDNEPAADVYVLKTVQGVAVPYALTYDPSIAISGREVTVSPDGTFTDVVELTVGQADWREVIPSTERGTYTTEGTALHLVYAKGQTVKAERVGRTLTLHDGGMVFVLAR